MTDKPKKVYGRTRSGLDITDDLIEKYVAEAEAGLDLSKLRPVGRPPMGSGPAKSFPVRLDPDLRRSLNARAAEEDKPAAEIVREALRRYLAAS